jgi:hypothetical protein
MQQRTSENNMPEKKKSGSYHFYLENALDWDAAFEGQWFMGVYETTTKTVMLLPSEIQWKPSIAQNADERSFNRYASGAKKKPDNWSSVASDGDTPGDLAWHKTQPGEPAITLHGKICKLYGVDDADCVGFTLVKIDRHGKFAQFKGSSKSLNDPWTVPSKMGQEEFEKVTPYSFAQRSWQLHKNPGATPTVSSGTTQLPERFRAELLKFFKEAWGVENIASSYE